MYLFSKCIHNCVKFVNLSYISLEVKNAHSTYNYLLILNK